MDGTMVVFAPAVAYITLKIGQKVTTHYSLFTIHTALPLTVHYSLTIGWFLVPQ